MNSYALLQLGPLVEQEYGRDRFVVCYVLTGIAGFFASQIFRSHTVGASASLSGLVGLLLVYAYRHHGGSTFKQVMLQNAILLLIISFAFPIVDWRAHLGPGGGLPVRPRWPPGSRAGAAPSGPGAWPPWPACSWCWSPSGRRPSTRCNW